MDKTDSDTFEMLLTQTADIVVAHVSNNAAAVEELPKLITSVYDALSSLDGDDDDEEPLEPAVSIRASVKNDHIVCLEEGKKMKMLKRHLRVYHDMSPKEYRKRWNLPADYPMVAPDYANKRRDLAKAIGLGRIPKQRREREKAKS